MTKGCQKARKAVSKHRVDLDESEVIQDAVRAAFRVSRG